MHRTRGTTPDADAGLKLDALGVGGCRVLDTCAGLGYTALGAVGRGAELVVSVELRPEVLRIAEMNPWSGGLTGGDVHSSWGIRFTSLRRSRMNSSTAWSMIPPRSPMLVTCTGGSSTPGCPVCCGLGGGCSIILVSRGRGFGVST
jgi:hypothetical protein